ncbi:MAG: glc operon protein GlcG, partial [Gaiellaceae bacterium]|nr:glc operon protein GlcG [Gaiellaceae bacterium]
LALAQKIVAHVVANAPGPVSVFVGDTHGELVAAARMDGSNHDTRFNAQRKAFTVARSGVPSTLALGEGTADDRLERHNFDPAYTFWPGGVAIYEGDTPVGAVGVSGLAGDVDDALARAAIAAAGLTSR